MVEHVDTEKKIKTNIVFDIVSFTRKKTTKCNQKLGVIEKNVYIYIYIPYLTIYGGPVKKKITRCAECMLKPIVGCMYLKLSSFFIY